MPDKLRGLRDKEGFEFPFLLDPAAATIKQWGLLNAADPGKEIPHPTVVILDRAGVVRFLHIDPDYRHRPPTEDLLRRLRELAE